MTTEHECIGLSGSVTTSVREAAEEWARNNFTPGRRIVDVELLPEALSANFSLKNGTRKYLIQWHDSLQRYCITVA